ncbi:MAG: protein kinase [Candidatus Marinimicrobia bacterium]|nr:protein kinase [Candidatus Neomarinimicrobiota bacterium]
MVGKVVAHYKILEQLGEGGMGVVYKAEDTKLHRIVALKFLPSRYLQDKEKEARFMQEARAASALDHPNICTIYEINETEDGNLYIAMGYYDGMTLKDKIKQGPLVFSEALDITLQIAKGLSKAHAKGIVHRDIKPGNIMITAEGLVKILDFGLAKMAGVTMTSDGSTLGTVAYMSPEQATGGNVDYRSDIWALGILFYEMLTGGLPFAGEYSQAMIYSILNEQPEPLGSIFPDLPQEVDDILGHLLEKEPANRYQSVDEFLQDLHYFQQDSVTRSINTSTLRKSARYKPQPRREQHSTTIVLTPQKRRYLILGTLAVIILLIFITTFISGMFYKTRTFEENPSLAVMYFDNRTPNEDLGKIVVDMLINNLSRIDKLEVVSSQRLFDILKKSGYENMDNISKGVATHVAREARVSTMLTGSIIEIGSKIRINAQVTDVKSGRNIFSEQVTGNDVVEMFAMVDELTKKIVARVGVTPEIRQEINISDITTGSLKAYEFYIKGLEDFYLADMTGAMLNIERALTVDSTFASAYLVLSQIYDGIGNISERNNAIIKARKYAEKSSKKEQLYIEAAYANAIENDLLKRIKILEQLSVEFFDDKQVHYILGTIYFELGDPRAFDEMHKALELDPDFGPALNALVYLYLKPENTDFEKALKTLNRYLELYPNEANPHDTMGDIYMAMGEIQKAIEKYMDASNIEPGFSEFRIGYAYALLEEYNMAFYWIKRSIDLSPNEGVRAERYQLQGFLHYWLGEYDLAIENFQMADKIFSKMENAYQQAVNNFYFHIVYKDKEEVEISDRYLQKMEEYFNHSDYGSTLHMMFKLLINKDNLDIQSLVMEAEESPQLIANLLQSKKWTKFYYDYVFASKMVEIGSYPSAIKFLEKNSKIMIRTPNEVETYIIFNLTRKNTLALAYYKQGNIDQAIAEYEKILRVNPDRNDTRLIHPSYHYELGIAYQSKGENQKALEQYQLFLEYWGLFKKDLPEIQDAKKRMRDMGNR